MKKTILTLGAAALAMTGAAQAQDRTQPRPGADRVITKADHDARAAKMWQRLDVNGDGTLDQADRSARMAKRFERIDANGDGEVTQAEMQAAREARQAKRAERRAQRSERRFARLDTDNSGGLSQEELNAGRAKMGAKAGERRGKMKRGGKRGRGGAMAMLRQADTNGDQRITRAEFEAAHAKRFAAMDANGDGQVTAAERKAARDKMRSQRRGQR